MCHVFFILTMDHHRPNKELIMSITTILLIIRALFLVPFFYFLPWLLMQMHFLKKYVWFSDGLCDFVVTSEWYSNAVTTTTHILSKQVNGTRFEYQALIAV